MIKKELKNVGNMLLICLAFASCENPQTQETASADTSPHAEKRVGEWISLGER